MNRFFLIPWALFWAALWFGSPRMELIPKIGMMAATLIPFWIVAGIPLANLAARKEIRRYCEARGFQVLKLAWRGVVYMDGHAKRYSRWPEDFRGKNQD
jgi:hypothetical protein